MKISREARILLAFVAVAGAAWVWINFFSQPAPSVTTQTPTVAPDAVQTENTDAETTEASEDDVPAVESGDADADEEIAEIAEDSGAEDSEAVANAEVDTDVDVAPADEADVNEDASTSVAGDTDIATTAPPTVEDEDAQTTAEEGAADDLPAIATESTTDAADDVDNADTEADAETGADTETTAAAVSGEENTGDSDLPSVDVSETAETSAEETVESSPSIATAQPVTARDIEVAELPFLVTEPPAPDAEATEDENGLELSRPRSGLRATVNPFSPLVVQAPLAPAVAQTPPSALSATPTPATTATTPTITEVPIPGRPGAVGQGIAPVGATSAASTVSGVTATARPDATPTFTTPTPRPLTPGATQVSNLPRPLPGGILTSTPDILRNTRVTPVATPTNALGDTELASVAALRLPGQSNTSVDFDEAPPAALEARAESDASPLPLGNRRPAPPTSAQTGPLVAGASGLSRYLRDNNYQFTGSVVGPVGVGVFRSNLSATPITVVLGQSLLDTDIVLTSLQGKQAEFTQDDEKQVLTLDLR